MPFRIPTPIARSTQGGLPCRVVASGCTTSQKPPHCCATTSRRPFRSQSRLGECQEFVKRRLEYDTLKRELPAPGGSFGSMEPTLAPAESRKNDTVHRGQSPPSVRLHPFQGRPEVSVVDNITVNDSPVDHLNSAGSYQTGPKIDTMEIGFMPPAMNLPLDKLSDLLCCPLPASKAFSAFQLQRTTLLFKKLLDKRT